MTTPEEVLIDHQRRDAGSCTCGWGQVGDLFTKHQVEMLRRAGFEVVRVGDGKGPVTAVRVFYEDFRRTLAEQEGLSEPRWPAFDDLDQNQTRAWTAALSTVLQYGASAAAALVAMGDG